MLVHVGEARVAKVGESAFEDTIPLLRQPANGNDVSGPQGMRAIVKADRQHHPRIYVLRSPQDSILLIDRYATTPRWAPSGDRIACTVWKSRRRPWELCIVTLGRPDTLYPLPGLNTSRYKWSPNARYLAGGATLEDGTASVLYIVDTQKHAAAVMDTLPVYSNYELGWSPDSRTIAVSRPIRLADMEQIVESELWLFDIYGRHKRIVPSEGAINSMPRWIDGNRLLYTRESPTDNARTETMVLDISFGQTRPQ